jgi:hypothetical protein
MAAHAGGGSGVAGVVCVLRAFDADYTSLTVDYLARRSELPVLAVHRIAGRC